MNIPIFNRLAAALAAMLMLCLLSASGASFSLPGAVNNGNGTFYFSGNTYANGAAPGPNGFGLTDADFQNLASGADAFDGAFLMRVNTTLFAAPVGGVSLSGNTLTTGSSVYSGISTSARFDFLGSSYPVIRAIYTFQNTTGNPITADLTWEVNLGSDNLTQIGAVSGLTPQTPVNRWVVSRDSAGQDAIVTLARYGTNTSETLPNSTGLFGGPNGDFLADQYHVTLQPNQTVQLMMFAELTTLSGGTNAAATAASVFDNYGDMASAGLLVGLDPNNLAPIINWSIPEPGTGVFVLIGCAVIWVYRRGKSRRA